MFYEVRQIPILNADGIQDDTHSALLATVLVIRTTNT
jgi:hypothetical protein